MESAKPLKGPKAGAVVFTRAEQSAFISDTWDVPSWVLDYGDVRQSGGVVVFIGDGAGNSILDVVPSGEGELDLISLVRDIVAVQSHSGKDELDAWLEYLAVAKTDHGRQAALRSLVQMNADWGRMRPSLDRLLSGPSLNGQMRGFTFGIIVFGLASQRWEQQQVSVADFLGRQFEQARSPEAAFQYILSLKLALRYAMEEAAREARAPMRRRIVESLKRRESEGSSTPELAEQYRQIRATFPGLL